MDKYVTGATWQRDPRYPTERELRFTELAQKKAEWEQRDRESRIVWRHQPSGRFWSDEPVDVSITRLALYRWKHHVPSNTWTMVPNYNAASYHRTPSIQRICGICGGYRDTPEPESVCGKAWL